MAAVPWESRVVVRDDDSGDSGDDGWCIGFVRCESQVGTDLSSSGALRAGAGRSERGGTQSDEMLHEDKNEVLKKALFRGDVSLIEELLNSGVSIESRFQFGWTPLMCAASVAHFAVVGLLLDRGANACFEKDKYTVLMAACAARASEENVLKTVELLLSRNADPNLTCRRQMTPLIYAASKGYPEVVALLVAHGSHIDAQDDNGYSALMWAAQHGHKSVILKLLELGADKNLQTKDEKTAAELAKANNHSEIHSLLSLSTNHLQRRYCGTSKQEAICKFMTPITEHRVGSYSAFGDLEVFLHGLDLEHIIGLLKERDITLRQLLVMQKDEIRQIGITNPGDQQKLLDAISSLQEEGINIGDLAEVTKLELSEDELLKFLQQLNKECNKLIVSVQTMNKHFLENSHKIVQWAPTRCLPKSCKDSIYSVEKLREEVTKMQDLMVKHEQESEPSQVKLPDKAPIFRKRLVKMGAVVLFGIGFVFFITKVVIKKKNPVFSAMNTFGKFGHIMPLNISS
ncbi:ankyrin repeat, SAM and basic leucine zipper domain-containing protein 1 [Colius striatus]|uniref:ankyrin repeat, SAM and basic leucine zipper domain-containing protein 1 n=1 Tax=Colius striatus TaxID=57412 RepID=UPI002B1E086A|nr:ankyrin repeat, SAM and basic leucine zipper domain-containing protein 1 [Colius striatus]